MQIQTERDKMNRALEQAMLDKEFGPEDLRVARVCYALLCLSTKGKQAIARFAELTQIPFPILDDDVETWIKNLRENDYFDSQGNIRWIWSSNEAEQKREGDIPFILMMLVAQGHLKARFVSKEKGEA